MSKIGRSILKKLQPRTFTPPTPKKKPIFLVDENLPYSVVRVLRKNGYFAFHTREVFGKGASDEEIMETAEKQNLVILTRDVKFPEPKVAGDRVLVVDLPKVSSEDEVLRRIKQLGW